MVARKVINLNIYKPVENGFPPDEYEHDLRAKDRDMAVPTLFKPFPFNHKVHQKAAELAVAITAPVRDAALARAKDMERAEARGYIRAKATPIIARQLQVYRSQLTDLDPASLPALAADVAERVVRLVLDDVVRSKVLGARKVA